MISSQIEKLSVEHAAQLAGANTTLTPVTGTPLAELVAFSSPSGAAFHFDGVISINSNNPEHDQAMDNYAQFCADAVGAHTSYARNVVAPALEDMQEKVQEGIKAIALSPFMDFSIEEFSLPEILRDSSFQSLLQRFRTNTSVQPEQTLKYTSYTNEQIAQAMMFGEVDLDQKIKNLIAALPDGHLQVIWQSVFQNQVVNRPTVQVSTYQKLIGDYLTGGNSALVIFILAYKLSREVGDDAGMDLVPAQNLLNLFCQLASSAVFRQMEFDQANISTNTLVRSYDENAKKVVVNKQLFDRWTQEAGGKPEVLLGLMLMREQPSTISSIAAKADQAIKTWNSYVVMQQSEQDAVFDLQARGVMMAVFKESLESGVVDQSEKDKLADGNTKSTAIKMFSDLLKAITPGQLRENFIDVFWRAACQARYHYTSAYQLLSDVDYEVKVRGQDLDDALTLAQNNYVCAFIADQILVS